MKTLLIRAEDKNIWERRSPIAPDDLKLLVQETAAQTYVEICEKRIFKIGSYHAAGARSCTGMIDGDVIVGVKEIPVDKLLNNKIYLFFSHVIKGQPNNMPMLKRIIQSGSTLIDYEKILDDQNRRMVYFGSFAGDAGALDILWLTGEHWQYHGSDTPLVECKQANQYHSLVEAKDVLRKIGQRILQEGFPQQISPVVIGILGYGNVSKGAQQIFDCLPLEHLEPENLAGFIHDKKGRHDRIYLTVFKEEHLAKNKSGEPFDLQEYYKHPENFESQFEQYLPHISILVNAIYWDKRYPRFVTWENLKRLYEKQQKPKLCAIADITCDINGSIECNVKVSDSGRPAYLVNPITHSIADGHKGDGIVMLAIDNLPCELPRDSSQFFSRQLRPFLPNILKADYSQPLEASGLLPELQKAVIVYNGKLTQAYRYLEEYLKD